MLHHHWPDGSISVQLVFAFGVGLTIMSPELFYYIGAAFAVMCIGITWVRYARPGAPKSS